MSQTEPSPGLMAPIIKGKEQITNPINKFITIIQNLGYETDSQGVYESV